MLQICKKYGRPFREEAYPNFPDWNVDTKWEKKYTPTVINYPQGTNLCAQHLCEVFWRLEQRTISKRTGLKTFAENLRFVQEISVIVYDSLIPSVCLPVVMAVDQSTCPRVCLSDCPSIRPLIPSSINVPNCSSMYLSLCPSVDQSTCQPRNFHTYPLNSTYSDFFQRDLISDIKTKSFLLKEAGCSSPSPQTPAIVVY